MNELIIKLFNKAIPTKNTVDFTKINEKATKFGYLIHPDVANIEVSRWLDKQNFDYNSTFYKSWHDVTSKSRFEIWTDQILSYISNYVFNTQFVPNNGSETPDFTKYKVILPITEAEVIDKCLGMLYSGIALKQDTIEDILIILSELDIKINIEKVKNKEAKMFLYKRTNSTPTEAVEMVRFLVYLATAKTLLIKDKATLDLIKIYNHSIADLIKNFGIDKLSSVFYRFKPIFLAFKKNKFNKKIINELRRKAVKNHIPLKAGFFETLLSEVKDLLELSNKLNFITNFKKVLLLQTIKIRLKQLDNRVFSIRNNKIWIQEKSLIILNKNYYNEIYNIIYNNLIENLSKKATTIKLPTNINLTIPTSEKSFVGNYPLGTNFDLFDSNTIVGITRKPENAAGFLDFSLNSSTLGKIGWNQNFYNSDKSIIFSGDICDATKTQHVTELFYAKKGFEGEFILKVNDYDNKKHLPFRFFLAQESITNMHKNYMVDPNNIKLAIDLEMEGKEMSIGVIRNDKLILAKFRTGNTRVSKQSITDLYSNYALAILDCYLPLNELLIDAGFKLVDKDAKIDLSDVSKDSLISLLS